MRISDRRDVIRQTIVRSRYLICHILGKLETAPEIDLGLTGVQAGLPL